MTRQSARHTIYEGKTRITIHLDDEILANFREQAENAGVGYQTLMNEA